jgi:hypothetical protein
MRSCHQLVERISKLLCIGYLFLLILLLQDPVEVWHNIPVDLGTVSDVQ